MIVVADSGPLHYLILLQHIELLRRFYGQVLVPEPVAGELSASGAPAVVRDWITKPPTWVDASPVPSEAVSMITDDLDLGERAAIALAETVHADLLLIDEAAGRAEAKRRHLRVTGTLGVLRAGAEQDLVNVPELLERLKATSFYLDETLCWLIRCVEKPTSRSPSADRTDRSQLCITETARYRWSYADYPSAVSPKDTKRTLGVF